MRDREYSAYRLLNVPGFGSKAVYYIYDNLIRLGLKVDDLFDNSVSWKDYFPEIGRGKFSRANFSAIQTLDNEKIYASFQRLKSDDIYIIGLDDERYPKSLVDKLGENAPPVLFCKGHLPLLNVDSVSIAGSRDASDVAYKITQRIAVRLSENGYNITSGFAKGVDTHAHTGALEGGGTTTAVLSYGFNYLSIKKDIKAYNDWEQRTLFITQFMPYEKFSGQNAMTRNKLVCALSKAVIVISSGPARDGGGKMSGTFDAGSTTLKYNIPLFVLNPSLLKPAPQGNIDLIKMGGTPLSNGEELEQYLTKIGSPSPLTPEIAPYIIPESSSLLVEEPESNYDQKQTKGVNEIILDLLGDKALSTGDILEQAQLDWTPKKLIAFLKMNDEIEIIKKGNSNYFKKKNSTAQINLF